MKFSIKAFFKKYDQIRRKLPFWLLLLKKYLMENFIFCAVCCEKFKKIYNFKHLCQRLLK